MDFEIELNNLIEFYNSKQVDKFKSQDEIMRNNFPAKVDVMANALKEAISLYEKKFDADVEEVNLKVRLLEVTEVVSLSYIAKHYFNRTRNWLYQRINGNIVKGKPARFTEEEIQKLQFAINDIGRKLQDFQISM